MKKVLIKDSKSVLNDKDSKVVNKAIYTLKKVIMPSFTELPSILDDLRTKKVHEMYLSDYTFGKIANEKNKQLPNFLNFGFGIEEVK